MASFLNTNRIIERSPKASKKDITYMETKGMTYVASPYSHGDREENFRLVSKKTAQMVAEGTIAISPITYGHTLLEFKSMPNDWKFWQEFCLSILSKCDNMVVYMMPGWDKSEGVAAEISYARDMQIPIEYIEFTEEKKGEYPHINDWTPKWDL
jgi:hypothetical protein